MSARRITIKDVAAHAGVTISTVSYTLSGKRSIPAAVQLRVRQAISELGYEPNANAQALRQAETRTLALLIPAFDTPLDYVHMELTSMIAQAAAAMDYDLLLTPETGDSRIERLIHGRRVDGVIFLDVCREDDSVERLRATRIPLVAMGRPAESDAVSLVDIDYAHIVRRCVQHLFDHGHRQILFMNKSQQVLRLGFGPARDALDGFRKAVEKLSIQGWASCCDHTDQAAERWVAKALADRPDATGIVTINEAGLPGIYRGLAAAGRSVPGDVSIVGAASARWASAPSPQLTSADLPVERQAREVVTMLVERLRDPDAPLRQLVLAPSLTVRGSSGPAPVRQTAGA